MFRDEDSTSLLYILFVLYKECGWSTQRFSCDDDAFMLRRFDRLILFLSRCIRDWFSCYLSFFSLLNIFVISFHKKKKLNETEELPFQFFPTEPDDDWRLWKAARNVVDDCKHTFFMSRRIRIDANFFYDSLAYWSLVPIKRARIFFIYIF